MASQSRTITSLTPASRSDDDVSDDDVKVDDVIIRRPKSSSIIAKLVGDVFVVVVTGQRRGGVSTGDPGERGQGLAVARPATGLEDDANDVLLLLVLVLMLPIIRVGSRSGARRVVKGRGRVGPEERVPVVVEATLLRGAEPRQGLLGPKRGCLEAPPRLVGRR